MKIKTRNPTRRAVFYHITQYQVLRGHAYPESRESERVGFAGISPKRNSGVRIQHKVFTFGSIKNIKTAGAKRDRCSSDF